MAGFSLLSLTPLHLEKVINKIQEKSYFRLQQTCRDVKEFIRTSRRISINLDGRFDLVYNKNISSIEFYSNPKGESIQTEALYGTRIRFLRFRCSPVGDEEFNLFCDLLKKNRITCIIFNMLGVDWTTEQTARVLHILEPEKVDLNSQQSSRYEALFQPKTKSVDIILDSNDVIAVAERLLSTFRYVTLHAQVNSTPITFLRWILHLFYTKPFPNLCGLSFDLYGNSDSLSSEEIMEQFQSGFGGLLGEFKVTTNREQTYNNGEIIYVSVDISHLKSSCTVTIIDGHLIVIECFKKKELLITAPAW